MKGHWGLQARNQLSDTQFLRSGYNWSCVRQPGGSRVVGDHRRECSCFHICSHRWVGLHGCLPRTRTHLPLQPLPDTVQSPACARRLPSATLWACSLLS